MREEKKKDCNAYVDCGLGLVRGTCCLFWGGIFFRFRERVRMPAD